VLPQAALLPANHFAIAVAVSILIAKTKSTVGAKVTIK
jgi:hypothetical protein